MGHKKRKQDSDNEDDVENSASESDVSDSKATKSKSKSKSTSTKGTKSASKTKTVKKPKIDESDDGSIHEEKPTRVPTNAQGEKYVDLGKMKRVTVRPFKGHLYVDIREFYAAGPGDEKPGKKGISLTVEQWEVLKNNLTTIDSLCAELKGKK